MKEVGEHTMSYLGGDPYHCLALEDNSTGGAHPVSCMYQYWDPCGFQPLLCLVEGWLKGISLSPPLPVPLEPRVLWILVYIVVAPTDPTHGVCGGSEILLTRGGAEKNFDFRELRTPFS